ncbi:YceI family protein [Winogradskyella sp. SYSU M77433]|nr:YceI family protein [Winogradskyella sp. SYSU M77433]
MMRTISIVVLFFLSSIFSLFIDGKEEVNEATIYFSSDSCLKINGKTNVNTFDCGFNMESFSDEIKVSYKAYNSSIKFSDATLKLPNVEFNCGGKAINKDFNKLLNTEKHPEIILRLKEISEIDDNDNSVTATVEIVICKISKTYTVPISVTGKDGLFVSGILPININDYSLEAPTKMLGMVKVSPQIEIDFSLKILKS